MQMSISYWFYSTTGGRKDLFSHPKMDYQGVIISAELLNHHHFLWFMNGKLYSHGGLKPAKDVLWHPPVFHLISPQGESNSQQPYKQRKERCFYPPPHLHQSLQLSLKRCSVHREGTGTNCTNQELQRGCTPKASPGEQLQLQQQSPTSCQQRRFRKKAATQALSQAPKGLIPNPTAWLWAPSTAFLHGQSMCMVSPTLLFWCLNKSGAYVVVSPLNKRLLVLWSS